MTCPGQWVVWPKRQVVDVKPSKPRRHGHLSGLPCSLSSLLIVRRQVVTYTKGLEKLASNLHPCCSKCGRELVRNTESQSPPQPYWIRICILRRFPFPLYSSLPRGCPYILKLERCGFMPSFPISLESMNQSTLPNHQKTGSHPDNANLGHDPSPAPEQPVGQWTKDVHFDIFYFLLLQKALLRLSEWAIQQDLYYKMKAALPWIHQSLKNEGYIIIVLFEHGIKWPCG